MSVSRYLWALNLIIYLFFGTSNVSHSEGRYSYGYLLSEVKKGDSCTDHFLSAPDEFVADWVGLSVLEIVNSTNIAVIPRLRIIPREFSVDMSLPDGEIVVNPLQTDLNERIINLPGKPSQHSMMIRVKKASEKRKTCLFIQSQISGRSYIVTIPSTLEEMTQLAVTVSRPTAHANDDNAVWIALGMFLGCMQLAGWIATPFFLSEVYAPNGYSEECYCSGVVAYFFTMGLAGIPHLALLVYIKLRKRNPELQPLL